MKSLLASVALLATVTQALADNCPDVAYDYMADIVPIRKQERILDAKIDNAPDTATALRYVREEQALDDRISKIVKTMNECDAIGQSILKDSKD